MLALDAIAAAVAELGEPAYRSRQIYQALTRGLVTDFASMTSLPQRLRGELAQRLSPLSLRAVDELRGSRAGGACKTLFVTADDHPVEAVLMRVADRATVCVSTQVGCAVGCAFCASGRLGLRRNLTAEEIVDQVLHFARLLRDERGGQRDEVRGGQQGKRTGEHDRGRRDERGRGVTNVVFMGMGEPFHNYDETLRACRLLNDPDGFGLAARHIAVSTAGVVTGIDRFAAEPLQFNLAVSLHAVDDELRNRLVPLNRSDPLEAVFAACERYVAATRRKLFFEYVVLRGVNDAPAQVAALAQRLRRPLFHLNLIAYNDAGGAFRRPAPEELAALRERLERAGVSVTVRRSPGGDIAAACGQLASRHEQC